MSVTNLSVLLPNRSKQPDKKGGIIWNTDGSKINNGTGAGMYGYGTRWKLTFGLGQYTTVFQA
jgi:hypothetical protein